MAKSVDYYHLARIAIPDDWFWNDQITELPHLANELTNWSKNLERVIKDLLNHTKPTIPGVTLLWKEAFLNINSICYKWIKILLDRMESSLWHMRSSGQISRYKMPGVVHFASTITTLKRRYTNLDAALSTFYLELSEFFEDVPQYGNKTTSRPPIEILFNAILLTRRAGSASNRDALASMARHWLDNAPASMTLKSFKTDRDGDVSIGTPNCLAALFTGSHLSTGSTLVTYGKFVSRLTTTYHGQESELPSYHRDMRYSRYSRKDQSVLNVLINKAVDWLNIEAEELQRQYRATSRAQIRAMAAYNMESNAKNIGNHYVYPQFWEIHPQF